ncbi:MAG: PaaI family thioesterase [Chryseotalea sp. WA131a]|jgi:acyl-coenzyme A thioesterase PaaI-like protein|nr:MAG: PaaI family thioesterase [Chryseotalea sp. WA131a]
MNLNQLHTFRQVAANGNWKAIEDLFNESVQLKQMHIRVDLSTSKLPMVFIDEVMDIHKGGIGTDAVNGAVIALLSDLAIGLLGIYHYADGLTATSSLTIHYVKPLLTQKVIVKAEETQVIGKRIFGVASIMNEKDEVCSYANGSLAKGIVI